MLIEELQIGNYVNHNNEVIIVDSISEKEGNNLKVDNYGHCPQDYWIEKDKISAIPLTADWLEKFNYCVDEEWHSEYKDKNLCDDGEEGFHSGNKFSLEENTFYIGDTKLELICSIVYVHQFQNLHYLLTGNKLKIK